MTVFVIDCASDLEYLKCSFTVTFTPISDKNERK